MISITKFLLLASVVAQGAISAPANKQQDSYTIHLQDLYTVHFIHNYTPQKMVEMGTCVIADPSKMQLPECVGGLHRAHGKDLTCSILSPRNNRDRYNRDPYKAMCETNGGEYTQNGLKNKDGKPYTAEILLLDSRKDGRNEFGRCTNVTFDKVYPYFGPSGRTGTPLVACQRLIDFGNSQFGCVRRHINTTPRVKWAKEHFQESCQFAGGQIVRADNKKP